MSKSQSYDDLDEMIVPKDTVDIEDDIKVGKQQKQKQGKKGAVAKTPRQMEIEAEEHRKTVRIVLILAGVFAVVLALLIAVGIWMSSRVPGPDVEDVPKAVRDETKGLFKARSDDLPDLSKQGIKARPKEVYYTPDGKLAVTLNLSNGTPKDMEVVSINIRLFNDNDKTIAEQEFKAKDLPIKYTVKAHGRGEMYFEIDKQYVFETNDPLTRLGATCAIGCKPTDGSTYEAPAENNAVVTPATSATTVPPLPTSTNDETAATVPEENGETVTTVAAA